MSHRSSIQTMSSSHADRWLLPRHQAEYPARDLLDEETLHGRREASFLLLGAVFLVTTTLLVVLGASRIIDPAPVLAELVPAVELPFAMQLPLGVIPFALAGVALALVCELFGRRRAGALVAIGLLVTAGSVALLWFADRLDGRDAMFGPALGFASCYLVGHLLHVLVFDALRRRMAGRHLWLRLLVVAPIAQAAGWAAFGAALYGHALWLAPAGSPDVAAITALATGSALYTVACIVVLALPVALVAHGLRLYLRVGRGAGLRNTDDGYRDGPGTPPVELPRYRLARPEGPEAPDVRDTGSTAPPRRRRGHRPSIQPFSSAEMRFFAEGDQLSEA
jgi:uncharacterized PurR-regulated membrane protein YhhQ (DUF165 family)